MSEWTGGVKSECPAVKELRDALRSAVPLLAADTQKIGTVRNDGSRHTAGLAMDIMLDSRDLVEKSVADNIIDALVKVHAQMRWADLIYTDWNNGKPSHFHIPGMPPLAGPKGCSRKTPHPRSSANSTRTIFTSIGGRETPRRGPPTPRPPGSRRRS
jgi:hypothetical protein